MLVNVELSDLHLLGQLIVQYMPSKFTDDTDTDDEDDRQNGTYESAKLIKIKGNYYINITYSCRL